MKKIILTTLLIVFYFLPAKLNAEIRPITEGNIDAKIKIVVFESLTCGHCAKFHKDVYPGLKENFIDKGHVYIEFKNFPLDMAALNASKIAHCKKDGNSKILHYLYNNQKEWTREERHKLYKDVSKFGFDAIIQKKSVKLGSKIKTIGEYSVDIDLHPEVNCSLDIEILSPKTSS